MYNYIYIFCFSFFLPAWFNFGLLIFHSGPGGPLGHLLGGGGGGGGLPMFIFVGASARTGTHAGPISTTNADASNDLGHCVWEVLVGTSVLSVIDGINK